MYEFLIFMFSNVWRGLAFIVCFAILVDGIVDLVKAIRGIDKKEKTLSITKIYIEYKNN